MAAVAGVVIALALGVGLLMTPEAPPVSNAAPAAGDLNSMVAAALESIGLDSTRVLGARDELEAAFERRRADLPAEAAESVDENLAMLDRNIAELSAALEKDPGNPELARLLASAYRRQVEMLRTVDRVGPGSHPERAPEGVVEPSAPDLSQQQPQPGPPAV